MYIELFAFIVTVFFSLAPVMYVITNNSLWILMLVAG